MINNITLLDIAGNKRTHNIDAELLNDSVKRYQTLPRTTRAWEANN